MILKQLILSYLSLNLSCSMISKPNLFLMQATAVYSCPQLTFYDINSTIKKQSYHIKLDAVTLIRNRFLAILQALTSFLRYKDDWTVNNNPCGIKSAKRCVTRPLRRTGQYEAVRVELNNINGRNYLPFIGFDICMACL